MDLTTTLRFFFGPETGNYLIQHPYHTAAMGMWALGSIIGFCMVRMYLRARRIERSTRWWRARHRAIASGVGRERVIGRLTKAGAR